MVSRNRVLGALLLVLGLLVLLGELSVGFLLPILGAALVVVAMLVLLDILPGSTRWAVVVLGLGLGLHLDRLAVPDRIVQVLDLVVAITLVVMGASRLR